MDNLEEYARKMKEAHEEVERNGRKLNKSFKWLLFAYALIMLGQLLHAFAHIAKHISW